MQRNNIINIKKIIFFNFKRELVENILEAGTAMLHFESLWKTTTLHDDCWRNISGMSANLMCCSSGEEVKNISTNLPSWISNSFKKINHFFRTPRGTIVFHSLAEFVPFLLWPVDISKLITIVRLHSGKLLKRLTNWIRYCDERTIYGKLIHEKNPKSLIFYLKNDLFGVHWCF